MFKDAVSFNQDLPGWDLNNDTDSIGKNTIVRVVLNHKTKIRFEKLINILSDFDDDIEEYMDGMIEDLKEHNSTEFDGSVHYNFYLDEGVLIFDCSSSYQGRIGIRILEKIFNEEFLYMQSTQFGLDVNKYNGEILVNSSVCSKNKEYLKEVTKGCSYFAMDSLKDENFMNSDEKKLFKRYYDDESVEKFYNAKYITYYMMKKHFNSDKWWIGWTPGHH